MPDVSKLRLDNVSYDIKDDNARKYLVMVNEEPVSATKMVVETGGDAIELALQEDVDAEVAARQAADITEATARQNAVTTLQTSINSEVSARTNADTALSNQIAALQGAVGSPLVAATAAAMTDHTKIYVYTGSESGKTAGHWYYWNGSAWTDGGVYNSTAVNTDKTLSVSGSAADAKATGDFRSQVFDDINISASLTPSQGANYEITLPRALYPGQSVYISAHASGTCRFAIYKKTTPMSESGGYTLLLSNTAGYEESYTASTTETVYSFRIWISNGGSGSETLTYSVIGNGVVGDVNSVNKKTSFVNLSVTPAGTYSVDKPNYNQQNGYIFRANRITYTASQAVSYQSVRIRIDNPVHGALLCGEFERTGGNGNSLVYTVYYNDGTPYTQTSVYEGKSFVLRVPDNTDYIIVFLYASASVALAAGTNVYFDNVVVRYLEQDGSFDPMHPYVKYLPIFASFKKDTNAYNSPWTYKPLVLLHYSDVHGYKNVFNRVVKFADNFAAYIDNVINTGDTVLGAWEDGIDFYKPGSVPILAVIGNHDAWTNGVSGCKSWTVGYSAKQCYDRYIAPFKYSNTGYTYVTDKCYWTRDYPDQNIRLIAIDNYHWREVIYDQQDNVLTAYPNGDTKDTGEQATWFVSQLSAAKTAGRSVIVTCHTPTQNLDMISCTFSSLDDMGAGGLQAEAIEAVQDFIDGGGEFICWLTGHTHIDKFGTIPNYPDQLAMAIDCCALTRDNGDSWSNLVHMDGTANMDCMNIFCVDPNRKFLKLMRVGCEYDRNGRHIGSLLYNYQTKQLLWND